MTTFNIYNPWTYGEGLSELGALATSTISSFISTVTAPITTPLNNASKDVKDAANKINNSFSQLPATFGNLITLAGNETKDVVKQLDIATDKARDDITNWEIIAVVGAVVVLGILAYAFTKTTKVNANLSADASRALALAAMGV